MKRGHLFFLQRALRLALATLIVAVVATVVTISQAPTASAIVPALFDPIPSVAFGTQSVYGGVVTDGRGTFHAVVREDWPTQAIAYRRSIDGGRTWTTLARFDGDDGGATRPSVAVDGDRVAIAFIGARCTMPDVCDEAPYLVTSKNAGLTWDTPRRLDTYAFDVKVAVDDDRTWVAWERSGKVELRGTTNGGITTFASKSYSGYGPTLDAADGTMALAFSTFEPPLGKSLIGAVTAQVRSVGPMQAILRPRTASPKVTTAGGYSHLLLVDDPVVPGPTAPQAWVATAAPGAPFAPADVVMPAGSSATIDAVTGSVAVGVLDNAGTTWVAASSNDGLGFSAAIPVSSSGRANTTQVDMAFATPPQGRPLARFNWTVPPRYVDTDGDGIPDPANASGNDTVDQLRVAANRTMTVNLDGCDSWPSEGRTIAMYTWTVDGSPLDAGPDLCSTTITLDDGESASVRLDVEDDMGTVSSVVRDVAPRDHVIVSIGDSVASGEGSPETTPVNGPATWTDGPCHRTAYAGPAVAAQRLEAADPRSSVTFIQLACSGAAIVDVPEVDGVDDPDTGGLLDDYQGVVPAPGSLRPPQLDQMSTLVGSRPVDALLISIGANDVKFSDVVKGCLLENSCEQGATRTALEFRMSLLPHRYLRLQQAIAARGIPADHVRLTEYFDPTTDSLGVPDMRCTALGGVTSNIPGDVATIDDDEAIWARANVIGPLNANGRAAAALAGWRYVGGIAQQFARHGYCADQRFVVQLGESFALQGDKNGAFHPNLFGQQVYGSALFADLQSTLLIPSDDGSAGASGGPAALGDLMVVTTNENSVTSAAVNMSGGAPIAGAVRRLDRLTNGDGLLYPGGPPAVDGSSAVAVWTQLSGVGAFHMQTRAAQVAVRPNAAVRGVHIVQAPADASLMVAGRPSLVQATIDASVDAPVHVDVTTTVTAHAPWGDLELVPATTQQVTLAPGRNEVLLPAGSTFTADDGETLTATVEVSDPLGASPADAVDNTMSIDPAKGVVATSTRPLRILFGRADVGGDTLSCQATKSAAERLAAYAQVAMPVDASGVDAGLFCGLQPQLTHSEQGVTEGLQLIDEMARQSVADAVVVVVPSGWLQDALDGAIGVASAGGRAVIMEADASHTTLAHELGHVFGLDHTNGLVPAFGARVDTRMTRAGVDWMASVSQSKAWTGGATWDRLVTAIGGPDHAPVPLDVDGPGVWIRGTVTQLPDGSWGSSVGQWVRSGGDATTDPVLPDQLDLTRMTIEQLDIDGNLLDAEPVALGAIEFEDAGNATALVEPTDYTFATHVAIDPTAVTFTLTLDGDVVATRQLTGQPTVTLTSPTAGASVPRGAPLTVTWNMNDPDGDPLTADLLISDDDGATWRPLAAGVTDHTITMPVPQDVGGNEVRVKVVVSDGVQMAESTSDAFSAEPESSLGEEQIVFTRDDHLGYAGGAQVMTMRPDGSDVQQLALPEQSVYPDMGNGETACTLGFRDCSVVYRDPAWGADGRVYFSTDLQLADLDGPDWAYWDPSFRIWSSLPDGSDPRRITPPGADASYWPTDELGRSLGNLHSLCPTVSPDGNHLAWIGHGATYDNPDHIWVADRVGDGWSQPRALLTSGPQPAMTMASGYPALSGPPAFNIRADNGDLERDSCPRWSPDSTRIATIGNVSFPVSEPSPRTYVDDSSVVVVDLAGAMHVVSPMPSYIPGTGTRVDVLWQTDFFQSVDWSGSALLVSRGFEDLSTFDPAGALGPSPKTFGVFGLDPADGSLVRVTPEPDQSYSVRPDRFKVSPGGLPYYVQYRPLDPQCGTFGASDMGVIDLGTGGLDVVVAQVPAGGCTVNDRGFDWGIRAVGGNGGDAPPLVAVDLSEAPDDGNAPENVDVTTVTEPSAEPAEGADDVPAPAVATAASSSVTIPGDQPTVITLHTVDGTPAHFQIVEQPPAGELSVTSPQPDGSAVITELDGEIVVTPAPGFRGSTSLTYSAYGDPDHVATLAITVTGNEQPIAADDELDVQAQAEAVFDPAALLQNDVDPDAPLPSAGLTQSISAGLELVSVFGLTNGKAWIDLEGRVHVLSDTPGSFTFHYIVADPEGATDSGLVEVRASAPSQQQPPTTTTTTTPPPQQQPAPPTTAAPSAPTTQTPTGQLPRTGGGLTLWPWAATLVVAGVLALEVSKRRERR